VVGATSKQEKLHALLQKYSAEHSELKPAFFSRLVTPSDRIGRNFVAFLANLRDFFAFTGENFVNLLHAIVHPRSIRLNAIVKNIEEAGVRALPIVPLAELFRASVLKMLKDEGRLDDSVTQHIPDQLAQMVRYVGWYSITRPVF